MVYLSLGSNLGKREEFLSKARELIELNAGKILQSSSVYETEPWQPQEVRSMKYEVRSMRKGLRPQLSDFRLQLYLNQVICIDTTLSPQELLEKLLNIEILLGRIRSGERWQPRTIDIDILFYNDIIIKESELIIPHPYLHERKFTLIPLDEIAPDFIHPLFNKNINKLLKECRDTSKVMSYKL